MASTPSTPASVTTTSLAISTREALCQPIKPVQCCAGAWIWLVCVQTPGAQCELRKEGRKGEGLLESKGGYGDLKLICSLTIDQLDKGEATSVKREVSEGGRADQ